jgi:hypothetical protein
VDPLKHLTLTRNVRVPTSRPDARNTNIVERISIHIDQE